MARDDDYTEIMEQHFLSPRNVGVIDDAEAIGRAGSEGCGDQMTLTLRITEGRITDARFKTFGCAAAIASSSMLTCMVIGRTLEEAARITNAEVALALGGVPARKQHCSVMAEEGLASALADYRHRQAAGA